jgi:hypothetical protein
MDSNTLRKITPATVVTTVAGKTEQGGSINGAGTAARLRTSSVVVDTAGNLFVLNQSEGLVRKITQAGVVTTFAGGGTTYDATNPNGDGTGSNARFTFPIDLAIDSTNNLYVVGAGVVRKITSSAVVTTIAGVTQPGFGTTPIDGTGSAARFAFLSGVVVDSAGNLFVSDNKTIRKITPSAVVTTFAGNATSTGFVSFDGNGASATFVSLQTITIDRTGTLYVSDNSKIRKITPAADVTTYGGVNGNGYVDGDISVAKFNFPSRFAFDMSNNLYVTDSGNNVIRKITTTGQVNTVVGTVGRKGVVEGLLSGVANLASPQGVAVYGGKLYISDENSILKVNGLP